MTLTADRFDLDGLDFPTPVLTPDPLPPTRAPARPRVEAHCFVTGLAYTACGHCAEIMGERPPVPRVDVRMVRAQEERNRHYRHSCVCSPRRRDLLSREEYNELVNTDWSTYLPPGVYI